MKFCSVKTFIFFIFMIGLIVIFYNKLDILVGKVMLQVSSAKLLTFPDSSRLGKASPV